MPAVIQIVGLVGGASTPFDGQYLVEYDPERDGADPTGQPMSAHIVCSSRLQDAQQFPTAVAALEEWRRVCKRDPVRLDGKPNRPMTAFTVEIVAIS